MDSRSKGKRSWWPALAVGAAGVASAFAAYYWWDDVSTSAESLFSKSYSSLSWRPTACPVVRTSFSSTRGGIEETLDGHYLYIQDISAPQELEQLLPHISQALTEATDHRSHPPGSEPLSSHDKLRQLATLCITRALAPCCLIPALDLHVRLKLHIIGRHLFLQEKLGPGLPLVAPHAPVTLRKLPAPAVEAFLRSEHFINHGCKMLIERVREVVVGLMAGSAMDAPTCGDDMRVVLRTALLQLQHVGWPPGFWAHALIGPDNWTPSSSGVHSAHGVNGVDEVCTAMTCELSEELRGMLGSVKFAEAMASAMDLTFTILDDHLVQTYASLAPTPTPANGTASLAPTTEDTSVASSAQVTGNGTASLAPAVANGTASLAHMHAEGLDSLGSSGANGSVSVETATSLASDATDSPIASLAAGAHETSPHHANGNGTSGRGLVHSASDPGSISEGGGITSPDYQNPSGLAPTTSVQETRRRKGSSRSRSNSGSKMKEMKGYSIVLGSLPAVVPASSPGAAEKKPFARHLKIIQTASDPVFADVRLISKGICDLPSVKHLCSTAFSPAELHV